MSKAGAFFQEKTKEFLECEAGFERLQLLIDYAEDLQDFPKELFDDSNKVPGCVSNSLLLVKKTADGTLQLYADSDALTVKGFLALLVFGFSGVSLQTLSSQDFSAVEDFILQTGIKSNLTPTRANSFGTIVALLKEKTASLT